MSMMKSRWSKLSGVLVLVGALAGATGCSSGENASPAPSSEDVAKAPLAEGASKAAAGDKERDGKREGARGKRGGKHGFGHGSDNLLRAALHELELSDAQETAIKGALEKLREERGEHPRDAAWHAALAEGVRAGSIDKAAVEAKLAKMEGGFEEHRARMAEALTTLHATLTKEQRRELVDAVASKMEEKGARGPKGDGEGRRGKGDGERDGHRGPKGERGGWGDHGMKGGPLGHMLRDLNLTDEQRSKIDKALEASRPSEGDVEEKKEAFEARRAEMKTRLEGFAADSFDAKAFLAGDVKKGNHKNPRAHLDRMVTSLSAILPILTPAQRTSLAERLEKGPMGKPEHGEKRGEEPR
jgi:Spy/CpxP family protein refolding chaperone